MSLTCVAVITDQDRIWRPMIFICIWALVPGNGDAFNSFTQGCARECTDPDTGELLPDFGFCERNEAGEPIDPDCREQPNPDWAGSGNHHKRPPPQLDFQRCS